MDKKNVIFGVLAAATILAIGATKRIKDEASRQEDAIDITNDSKEE